MAWPSGSMLLSLAPCKYCHCWGSLQLWPLGLAISLVLRFFPSKTQVEPWGRGVVVISSAATLSACPLLCVSQHMGVRVSRHHMAVGWLCTYLPAPAWSPTQTLG